MRTKEMIVGDYKVDSYEVAMKMNKCRDEIDNNIWFGVSVHELKGGKNIQAMTREANDLLIRNVVYCISDGLKCEECNKLIFATMNDLYKVHSKLAERHPDTSFRMEAHNECTGRCRVFTYLSE